MTSLATLGTGVEGGMGESRMAARSGVKEESGAGRVKEMKRDRERSRTGVESMSQRPELTPSSTSLEFSLLFFEQFEKKFY